MVFYVEREPFGILKVFVNREADALGGDVYPGIPASAAEVAEWANEYYGCPFESEREDGFVETYGEWDESMIEFDSDAEAAVSELVTTD